MIHHPVDLVDLGFVIIVGTHFKKYTYIYMYTSARAHTHAELELNQEKCSLVYEVRLDDRSGPICLYNP